MNDHDRKVLTELLEDVRHLSEINKGNPQPNRGIMTAQLFIIIQKLRALIGDSIT